MGYLSQARQEHAYQAIKSLHNEKRYSIASLCNLLELNRSSYYKWLNRKKSANECKNEALLQMIREAYEERGGILGYRQMTIKLNRENDQQINHKRVYRLMCILGLKSVCRRKRYKYVRTTPEIVAENILNRDFTAEKTGQKWLNDVTEFKYGDGQKAYLSAILDLGDRSIVSYEFGRSNNNALVFDTFDKAVVAHPFTHPVFHSDRGFQYTNRTFKAKLEKAGMVQSMSRVGRCIDNGPMEGFWGIIKSEMYYLRKFETFDELEAAIHEYIHYYNSQRYQKRLMCMSPLEYRHHLNSLTA